ncbi:MAG: leishmanolysin-related zinc metalloendopeptidase, partial [Planctomycetaceae bacterium]
SFTTDAFTAAQRAAFTRAANRWAEVITGDLPDVTFNGRVIDDLLIDAAAVAIDGPGGILGRAGPRQLRSVTSLPFYGIMDFDTADLGEMERDGTLFEVILHEMGHVVGFGTIWSQKQLLSGAGTANPRFLGSNAAREYRALFGVQETSVPVEGNSSPVGSRDSHWRESVFRNELMTPRIGNAGNPLSRVTVASLADLGYTVNMNAADPFARPTVRVNGAAGVKPENANRLRGRFVALQPDRVQLAFAALADSATGESSSSRKTGSLVRRAERRA